MVTTMQKLKYERPVIIKMNAGLMNKFGTQSDFTPVTEIDGVPVKGLIKQYGSPVFINKISSFSFQSNHALIKATCSIKA
jgi:hypothetical protein